MAISQLLVFASFVAASLALNAGQLISILFSPLCVERCSNDTFAARTDTAACLDGLVVSSSLVSVGEHTVLVETVACDGASSKRDGFDKRLFHPTSKTSSSAPPTPTDVCGEICQLSPFSVSNLVLHSFFLDRYRQLFNQWGFATHF